MKLKLQKEPLMWRLCRLKRRKAQPGKEEPEPDGEGTSCPSHGASLSDAEGDS